MKKAVLPQHFIVEQETNEYIELKFNDLFTVSELYLGSFRKEARYVRRIKISALEAVLNTRLNLGLSLNKDLINESVRYCLSQTQLSSRALDAIVWHYSCGEHLHVLLTLMEKYLIPNRKRLEKVDQVFKEIYIDLDDFQFKGFESIVKMGF